MAVYGALDAGAGMIEGNEIPLRDTAGRDLDHAWQIARRHASFEIGPTYDRATVDRECAIRPYRRSE